MYIVKFLRLLQGLCLLNFAEAGSTGIENQDRESLTARHKISVFDLKMLQVLLEKASNAGNRRREIPGGNMDCLTAICKNYQERRKRSAFSESSIAQTKQNDDDDTKNKQTLLTQITPYAFGNPSLPGQSKKGKKKPKPRKPRG